MTPPLLLPALLLVLGVLLVGWVLYIAHLPMRPVEDDEAQEFSHAMREIEEKREAA